MLKKILRYISLQTEIEDFDTIHSHIISGIEFKGTKLWILMFAIVIASVGLNTNSTAVIIGAMLISPLMGPINGIGYSIATYDFTLLKRSIKNFTFAVLTGLIASTVYFTLSPVSTAYSELLARTSPTIYDVIIALFGGLAGIVAISSKLKGNIIPGAAIATALMPPLCTAGYGIATGQIYYFLGALYLFTINTVFIAISAVFISQFLKFPIRTVVNPASKAKVNRYITVIILLTLLPSIYFGYNLVQNEKFNTDAEKYTASITFFDGAYLIKNEIIPNERKIRLIYGGNEINDNYKSEIINRAKDFNLENAEIIIEQGFSLNSQEINENEVLKNRLNAMNLNIQKKEKTLDSLQRIPEKGHDLYNELKTLFPEVLSCSFANTKNFSDSIKDWYNYSLVIIYVPKNKIRSGDKNKITDWMVKRFKDENIKVIFEEIN
ncbi:MAG: hypothetical protein UZ05_CHB002001693 [Chlorobi bacterium OLB5]|nr:MAG: hypothetical protein UZ05_CHB002001693 [Chlorobi bacterium OLB5]